MTKIYRASDKRLRDQIGRLITAIETSVAAISASLAGYVTKALFNANTILAANADDTPLALTVAEQTLVGRITGGSIDDLSVAQVKTLLGIDAIATAANEEFFSFYVSLVVDQDYILWYDAPFAGTITKMRTTADSGTCTMTGKINTTALGGTANSVSSTPQEQAHASANIFAVGDVVKVTATASSSCINASGCIYITRT